MSVRVISYELVITEPDGSRGPRLFAGRDTLLDQIDCVMSKNSGRKIIVALNGGVTVDLNGVYPERYNPDGIIAIQYADGRRMSIKGGYLIVDPDA